jgi:hypothetical protein
MPFPPVQTANRPLPRTIPGQAAAGSSTSGVRRDLGVESRITGAEDREAKNAGLYADRVNLDGRLRVSSSEARRKRDVEPRLLPGSCGRPHPAQDNVAQMKPPNIPALSDGID